MPIKNINAVSNDQNIGWADSQLSRDSAGVVAVQGAAIITEALRNQANGFPGLDENGELPLSLRVRQETYADSLAITFAAGEICRLSDTGDIMVGDGSTAGGVLFAPKRQLFYTVSPSNQYVTTGETIVATTFAVKANRVYELSAAFLLSSPFAEVPDSGIVSIRGTWKTGTNATGYAHCIRAVGSPRTQSVGRGIVITGNDTEKTTLIATNDMDAFVPSPHNLHLLFTPAVDSNVSLILTNANAEAIQMVVTYAHVIRLT